MTPPLVIELPWPPSTNSFLRHFILPGRKHVSTCISAQGREYYATVGLLLLEKRLPKMAGALAVVIELYPPDRRKIDVDNRNKPILDDRSEGGGESAGHRNDFIARFKAATAQLGRSKRG